MRVFRNFPYEPVEGTPFEAVTIGVFDGIHCGHQRILERLLERAAGRPACLITFDPHPRAVLGTPQPNRLLTPIEERLEHLSRWPLAATAVLRFDAEMARMSYEDFAQRIFVAALGAQHLVLGYNVRIGRNREGTPETLAAAGSRLGYGVDLVAAVSVAGQIASSTAVRQHLDAGDVEAAAELLGRPYDLRGAVVRGAGRGRVLGIPTANLRLHPDKFVPRLGVYAVRVRIAEAPGRVWAGALNIGLAPTFAPDGPRSVEVHLLGFESDLYGKHLELDLLHRLRDEQRFPSVEALRAQIQADLDAVRQRVSVSAAP